MKQKGKWQLVDNKGELFYHIKLGRENIERLLMGTDGVYMALDRKYTQQVK